MNDLLSKISSYNLFNYLLPGVLFVFILKNISGYSFIQENIIVGAFIYYFIGLIVSRFGSLVVEPLLKKISFLKFTDYKDFVVASKEDDVINTLSEANNMYRTFCSLFILLLLFKIYGIIALKFPWLCVYNIYILLILLLIMFLLSYQKQTKYITKRIKSVLDKNEKNN